MVKLNREFETKALDQAAIKQINEEFVAETCEVFSIAKNANGKGYHALSVNENYDEYVADFHEKRQAESYEEAVEEFIKYRTGTCYLFNADNFKAVVEKIEENKYPPFLKATTMRYGACQTMEYMRVKGAELNTLYAQDNQNICNKVADKEYYYYSADANQIGEEPVFAEELYEEIHCGEIEDAWQEIDKKEFDLAWAYHTAEHIVEEAITTVFSDEILNLRGECEKIESAPTMLEKVRADELNYKNTIKDCIDLEAMQYVAFNTQKGIEYLAKKEDELQCSYETRITRPSSTQARLRTDIPITSIKDVELLKASLEEEKKGSNSKLFEKLNAIYNMNGSWQSKNSLALGQEILNSYMELHVLFEGYVTPEELVTLRICDNVEDAYVEWFKDLGGINEKELTFETVQQKIEEYRQADVYISQDFSKEMFNRFHELYQKIDIMENSEQFKQAGEMLYVGEKKYKEIQAQFPQHEFEVSKRNSDFKNKEIIVNTLKIDGQSKEFLRKSKIAIKALPKPNNDMIKKQESMKEMAPQAKEKTANKKNERMR